MCTVPVRMDFKNKETRSQAEHTLRTICKVSCSVPYPKKLRAALSTMITEGKTIKPGCFIRTKVDIDNLTISAYARGKEEQGWTHLDLDKVITPDYLDRQTTISQVTPASTMETETITVS